MTEAQILSEMTFIADRTRWLKTQPMTGGVLSRLDDRLEAGLMIKLIEEREQMLQELDQ